MAGEDYAGGYFETAGRCFSFRGRLPEPEYSTWAKVAVGIATVLVLSGVAVASVFLAKNYKPANSETVSPPAVESAEGARLLMVGKNHLEDSL